jgi:hypothetical protein
VSAIDGGIGFVGSCRIVTDSESVLSPLDVKLKHPSEHAATVDVAEESKYLFGSLERVEFLKSNATEFVGAVNDRKCRRPVVAEFR